MSALRASADHTVVLRANLTRATRSLLGAWRDAGSASFDRDVLRPLDQDADRLARAISAADGQLDTLLASLRRASGT